jgi:membrane protease YdiL (CAAX protease family)
MSSDTPPPKRGHEGITDRPPETISEQQPLIAEPAEDKPFVASLAEPSEETIPLRRARPGRRHRPGPPQPGFWWAIGWCVLMLIVAQVLPAIGVTIVALVGYAARHPGALGANDPEAVAEIQRESLLPAILLSQLLLTAFSLVALRLVVGRGWRREIGLRLPAGTHVVLAVLAWPALALAAAGCYLVAKEHLPGLDHILSYIVTTCATLAVIGTAWIVVRLSTGRDWTAVLAHQSPSRQLFLAPVGCIVAVAVGAQLFHIINPHLPSFDLFKGSLMEDMVKQVREGWPPLLAVLIIGLGPGIGEELWCRGFLGRGLVGRHGVVMGVILTSLFFGAIHGDPHQGMMAAIMGMVLHFSYLMTRSLWVPMLLHFLNNSLSVLGDKLDKLPGLSGERIKSIDTNPESLPWQLLAASACVLAAVGWALYTSRGRLVRTDGSGLPPWQPPYAGVAHPPPGSGTAVVYPWPGLLPTLAVVVAVVCFGYILFSG